VTWQAIGQIVAMTGADWRGLVMMPVGMFEEVQHAIARMVEG
jgi:hypothetical protein